MHWCRALVLTVTLCGLAAQVRGADRPPNIVVIIVDDLGYADLGCQGSRDVITPHIDSLARDGIRCTAGYVAAPQCVPSRAALLTGRYPQRYGVEHNPPTPFRKLYGLPEEERTLADGLKVAGYKTVGVGKWDLGTIP